MPTACAIDPNTVFIRCTLSVLFGLFIALAAAANPFLQKVARATPASRVILVLNYFDTCKAVTQQQPYAFRLLSAIDAMSARAQDEQLRRYCRFVKDTYAKNSNLSNSQKAALFLAVGRQAEQDDDLQIAAVCRHFAGQYYFINEEYGKAFEHLLVANRGFQQVGYGRIPEISRYLYELAFNYYYFKEYTKAIALLREAARYPPFNDNLAIQTPNTLGLAYTKISQLQNPDDVAKAEYQFNRARRIATVLADSLWIGTTFGNLAKIYVRQHKLTKALTVLRADYKIGLKFGKVRGLPDQTALSMAQVYLMRQQVDSCGYFLRQSQRLYRLNVTNAAFGSNLGNENYLRQYCDVARNYYQAVHDLPQAYRYLDSMVALDARINKRYHSEQISLVNQKLLIQKHQSEVEALETEKNVQQARVWIVGLLLALVALVAGLFYRLYRLSRLKRRQEGAINAEREKSLRLEKQIVEEELQRAKADLHVFMDNLQQKNALIDTITADLERVSHGQNQNGESRPLAETRQNLLASSLLTNDDWDEFRRRFERVHPHFFEQIKTQCADITPAEERLLALSKLNIDTRQMGRMLGISPNSIHITKYRLRKKLGRDGASPLLALLSESPEELTTH